MNRRCFLQTSAVLALLAVNAEANTTGKANRFKLISPFDHRDGRHHLAWLAADAESSREVMVDSRGHGIAINPLYTRYGVLFGRRPGRQSWLFDSEQGRIDAAFDATVGRHFYGHGCYAADGSVLFTTENDFDNQRGVIGIRDAQTLQHLGEWSSHGIGPHDIQLHPDARTLIVANGGIATHPDTSHLKLNLATMRSTLAYIDSQTGELLDEFTLPHQHLSIRHLAVAEDVVVVATQYQRKAVSHRIPVPLLAVQHRREPLQLIAAAEPAIAKLNDYIGSVALAIDHRVAAITSPRGNVLSCWHIDTGQLLAEFDIVGVCGLALTADRQYFVASNVLGEVHVIDSSSLVLRADLLMKTDNAMWDNHLIAVG